jgi:hypothetical protein
VSGENWIVSEVLERNCDFVSEKLIKLKLFPSPLYMLD